MEHFISLFVQVARLRIFYHLREKEKKREFMRRPPHGSASEEKPVLNPETTPRERMPLSQVLRMLPTSPFFTPQMLTECYHPSVHPPTHPFTHSQLTHLFMYLWSTYHLTDTGNTRVRTRAPTLRRFYSSWRNKSQQGNELSISPGGSERRAHAPSTCGCSLLQTPYKQCGQTQLKLGVDASQVPEL